MGGCPAAGQLLPAAVESGGMELSGRLADHGCRGRDAPGRVGGPRRAHPVVELRHARLVAAADRAHCRVLRPARPDQKGPPLGQNRNRRWRSRRDPHDGLPRMQPARDPDLRGGWRAVVPRALPWPHCAAVDRAARRHSADPPAHDAHLSAYPAGWPVTGLATLIPIPLAPRDQQPGFRAHQPRAAQARQGRPRRARSTWAMAAVMAMAARAPLAWPFSKSSPLTAMVLVTWARHSTSRPRAAA